jgi:hypothetical protein
MNRTKGILVILLCSIQLASAQTSPQSFSADEMFTAKGETTRHKVYAIEKALRVESEKDGKKVIDITRFDRYVKWALEPDDKTYLVLHTQPGPGYGLALNREVDYLAVFNLLAPGFAEFARKLQGAQVVRESLGTEQVGPYNCEKFLVRVTFQDSVYASIAWAAKELRGLIVKAQDQNRDWSTEYQNIQIGPQDPSLFEVPKDYKKRFEGYYTVQSKARSSK